MNTERRTMVYYSFLFVLLTTLMIRNFLIWMTTNPSTSLPLASTTIKNTSLHQEILPTIPSQQRPKDACYYGHPFLNLTQPHVDIVMAFELSPSHARFPELLTAINSLIYFASCRLQFHFIVSNATKQTLLRTNLTHDVDVNDTNQHQLFFHDLPDTRGVTTTFGGHAVAQYNPAVVKLFVDTVLPVSVRTALLMDFDVVFLRDVCEEFHHEMARMNDSLVGLAPDGSQWYIHKHPDMAYNVEPEKRPIPQSNGLNSGVVLLQLDNMRTFRWTDRWLAFLQGLEAAAPGADHLPLADQDIFNRFGRTNPHTIHVLPNRWNWQLSERMAPLPYDTILFHGNCLKFQQTDGRFMKYLWFLFAPDYLHTVHVHNNTEYVEPGSPCAARRHFFHNPKHFINLVRLER